MDSFSRDRNYYTEFSNVKVVSKYHNKDFESNKIKEYEYKKTLVVSNIIENNVSCALGISSISV